MTSLTPAQVVIAKDMSERTLEDSIIGRKSEAKKQGTFNVTRLFVGDDAKVEL